jgi:hypothetical protein
VGEPEVHPRQMERAGIEPATFGYRSRRTSVQPCGFRAGRATSRATDAPPGHDEADFTARRGPAPRPTGRAALEERTDGAIRAEVRRLKVSAWASAAQVGCSQVRPLRRSPLGAPT